MTLLRLATEADLPAINAIYNHYVLTSTCTYDFEPITAETRVAWFREHDPERYPVIVAERDGAVIGWGSLSKFRPRAGYDPTCEATVYIHADFHRQGLGRAILVDLIGRARQAGFHSIIGGASAEQTASIRLQESLGFQPVAHFREVGYKFGQRLDVVFLQLML
jgi:phosphinothricin acetyltransferase